MKCHLDNARADLRLYYQDNYLSSQPTSTAPHPPATELSSTSSSPQKVDFTMWYKKRPTTMKDELEEYFRLPVEDFDTCDPIQWWAGRRSQFPSLSRLARDILAIPGMFGLKLSCMILLMRRTMAGSAVAVERIFSGGRDTISLRRASLQPDTIRTLMLVKQRLRLARGVVNEVLDS